VAWNRCGRTQPSPRRRRPPRRRRRAPRRAAVRARRDHRDHRARRAHVLHVGAALQRRIVEQRQEQAAEPEQHEGEPQQSASAHALTAARVPAHDGRVDAAAHVEVALDLEEAGCSSATRSSQIVLVTFSWNAPTAR